MIYIYICSELNSPCREYQKAQEGIVGLSEVNRLGVMAALYVYGDILSRIRKNKYDNLRSELS